jgi:hypothetical protein
MWFSIAKMKPAFALMRMQASYVALAVNWPMHIFYGYILTGMEQKGTIKITTMLNKVVVFFTSYLV